MLLTRSHLAVTLAATVVLLSAPHASAEVRLQPAQGEGQHVRVVPTDRGVWSPVAQVGAAVLNPLGDMVGDAMPSVRDGATAFAAWHRPSTDRIRVARGEGSGWQVIADITAPGPVSAPLLATQGDEAVIVWTGHGSAPATRVASTVTVGESQITLPDSIAIEAWMSGSQLMLATFEPSWGGRGDIVINVIINPIEEPELVQSVVLDHDVSLSVASLTRRVAVPGAGDAEVLTWWPTPQMLRAVELRSGAPLLPVREHVKEQGGDYSPSLWNEAIRSLRKERD